jgi:hypothetical protein
MESSGQIVLVDRATGTNSRDDPAEDTIRVHVNF